MTIQNTSAQESPSENVSGSNPDPKKNSQKTKPSRWLWFWVGMGGIAFVSATAGALLAVSLTSTPLMQARLSPEDAAVFDGDRISGSGLRFSELTRPVNILVMGMSVLPPDIKNPPTDSQNLRYLPQVNSFDGLSDVMLLIRFDPNKKKVTMISIPRDTRVHVEGFGKQKINATNREGGPALSAKTASELLSGVGIDRYIRINVLGVAKLIDALGGVTVTVPKDMKYQDDSQHLYINLKAGKQHLNGDKALQLLRYRHDELGDIGRIQRQQMLMRALMEQTLNPATLARLPQILNVVQENIDTNLSVEELFALVGFGARTNRSNMQMLLVPGRFSEKGEYEASYWLPDQDGIDKMMAKHFELQTGSTNQNTTDPTRLRIAVQDTTGAQGTDLQPIIKMLQKSGYRNVYITKTTWQREPLETTKIVAQQGDGESAETVRNSLGIGEVSVESTGYLNSDITIQIGKDWLEQNAGG